MILAIDMHDALYVFSSTEDAEHELESMDVRKYKFEFCDETGQRFDAVYPVPPRMSRVGIIRGVDIGAFTLEAKGRADEALPAKLVERAAYIEHTSVPEVTSIESLRAELRRQS
jgi:hypothetical protein